MRPYWLLLLATCAGPGDDAAPSQAEPGPAQSSQPGAAPRIPTPPTMHAPAFSVHDPSGVIDGLALSDADADGCASCHADVVKQWRQSAHAFSSFDNPIYRVSVEGFREAHGKEASRFCAGCHDIALLIDGAMTSAVSPDDTRAHAGVSCMTCHGITKVTADGNGSWTLSGQAPLLPTTGDPASIRAHVERMTPAPLSRADLCGSCHRAVLGRGSGHDHHLAGADDIGIWRRSSWAGSMLDRVDDELPQQACADCHMPLEDAPLRDAAATDGRVRSHRFLGGHTWLAALRGNEPALARHVSVPPMTIAVSALRRGMEVRAPADGAVVAPGERLEVDVVLRNTGVGHAFPGGTLDMHDTWIELTVTDANGARIASAGSEHAEAGADENDPTLHLLHATMLDDRGRPVLAREVHRFRTPGYDTTIAPRERAVVAYRLQIPDEVALPLTIEAQLWHRSRERELQRQACEESKTPRGRSYEAARLRSHEPPMDMCAPQPIVRVASHRAVVGDGAGGVRQATYADVPLLLDHGAAWARALVEEIDTARPTLGLALEALGSRRSDEARRLRAATMHMLAAVSARQGRIDEMEHWLADAEAQLPAHPAYAWTRGRALASVWRHADAVPWLRRAAESAPLDDRGWTELAIAEGSLAEHRQALEAATRALALTPLHSDALRVQALAVRGLDLPEQLTNDAFEAFLTYRVRDDGPKLRAGCSARVPGCARERTPVHRHPTSPQSPTSAM